MCPFIIAIVMLSAVIIYLVPRQTPGLYSKASTVTVAMQRGILPNNALHILCTNIYGINENKSSSQILCTCLWTTANRCIARYSTCCMNMSPTLFHFFVCMISFGKLRRFIHRWYSELLQPLRVIIRLPQYHRRNPMEMSKIEKFSATGRYLGQG